MIRLTQIPEAHRPKEYPNGSFEYWMLASLPEEYAEAAINEPMRKKRFFGRALVYTDAVSALECEFHWASSQSGSDFWIRVQNHLTRPSRSLPPL